MVTDAAGVADVPAVPSCVPLDAANYPIEGASVDAAPGVCFTNAPPTDAAVADVPMPEHCPCAPDPPPFFGNTAVPAPTLDIEMGVGTDGTFAPYLDGQWVPITHGPQGGIHIWVAWRLVLPAHTEPKVKLLTRATSLISCALAGTGSESMWYATPDAKLPGAYTSVSANHPGSAVIFAAAGSDSGIFCGQWLELRLQIHDPVTKRWGEVRRTVRLYDMQPWKDG